MRAMPLYDRMMFDDYRHPRAAARHADRTVAENRAIAAVSFTIAAIVVGAITFMLLAG